MLVYSDGSGIWKLFTCRLLSGGADVSCRYHIMRNAMEANLAAGMIKSEISRALICGNWEGQSGIRLARA